MTTAIIGLVFGAIGTVLGVLNYWRSWDRDRVKLRVALVGLVAVDGQGHGIEVVNLSLFPLTIAEAGVTHSRRRKLPKRTVAMVETINGQRLPIRLESRRSVLLVVPPEMMRDQVMKTAHAAYVRTACNELATGRPLSAS